MRSQTRHLPSTPSVQLRSLNVLSHSTQLGVILLFALFASPECERQTQTRALSSLPPYIRHPSYTYILSESERENGVSYLPAAERLRGAIDKAMQGKNISLVALGSSITAGEATFGGVTIAQYIFDWVNDTFPGQVTCSNGAVPGTTSTYFSACHNIHVPADADIVIIEFTVNDWYLPPQRLGPFRNDARRGFERLVRKLLQYPNRPAVVLLHSYGYNLHHPFPGSFWSNAERDFGEFERYYHLPAVSTKAATYFKLRDQHEGFNNTPREELHPGVVDPSTEGKYFYYDQIHPDSTTGCRAMAELVMHLFSKVRQGLVDRPLTQQERDRTMAPIPEPMISGNYESASTRCFVANDFTKCVESTSGFEWINENRDKVLKRPKWGYVATEPGSQITFKIDTRATSSSSSSSSFGSQNATAELATVQLAHLKSYHGMGKAAVTCRAGCSCAETILDGHHDAKNSLTMLHEFSVSQGAACLVSVMVLKQTSSGGHKVKLSGIIASEVAGPSSNIDNPSALSYAADIAMLGKDGRFDVHNHA